MLRLRYIRLTRPEPRLLRALVASAATGCAIYLIVLRVALPELVARLTPEQADWIRQAFVRHPAAVLGTIAAIAALLALPVVGVFRFVFGPLTISALRNRGT